jgi:hypothetical protein
MGDIFSSSDTKNLVVVIFYCNLQLIHNFLQNKMASFPLPRRPTNLEKMSYKNGLKELQVVSAK